MNPALRLVLFVALSIAPACSGSGEPEPAERVMVVILDATHRAHVGTYGGPDGLTPTLDALAERSARFVRPFSNANWTLPSTACLMTGRLQEQHGVVSRDHHVSDDQALLAESFADAGFHTAGYSQMPYASTTYGFGRGFDEFHYYGNGRESELREGGLPILENVARWIRALEGQKWFAYVHLRRPHSPYDAPPKLVGRIDPDGPLADGSLDPTLRVSDTFAYRSLPPEQAARAQSLYRANLMAVDKSIDWLIAMAEAQGAVVVVTADHGEALGRNDTWGHGISVAADNIDIPLLIAGPGILARTHEVPASTIDLFPTLHELCGVELPENYEPVGRSLAGLLRGEVADEDLDLGPRLSTGKHGFGPGLQVAVVEGTRKLVLDGDGTSALFDRATDPLEEHDLSTELPEVAERLGRIARSWQADNADLIHRNRVEVEMTDEQRADLERLGYVDDGPTDAADEGEASGAAVGKGEDAPGDSPR
ncbi:sulfatase [Engelhardtia mirabilis]|uniref:Choline-sulfatase n=1 Tax=Engelhardtia mirabilis TaxID=2528011 RepID=A0A518BQH2_9BACT|nr:Choline-sulfatase [Planctomycetes bacterium Pla133]QDV03527.1 Choline-sulfatase [Planctomycetes bacterium Pla86]